jgi:hypothetical protein
MDIFDLIKPFMGFELMQKQFFLYNSVSSYVNYKFLHGTENPPFPPDSLVLRMLVLILHILYIFVFI